MKRIKTFSNKGNSQSANAPDYLFGTQLQMTSKGVLVYMNRLKDFIALSILLMLWGNGCSHDLNLLHSGPLSVKDIVTTQSDSLAWSPDGKYIAVHSDNKVVHVFDSQTSKEVTTLPISGQYSGGQHCNVAFSPDGKWLAAGLVDISVWEAGTWSLKGKIAGPKIDINKPPAYAYLQLAIAPDSQHIVVTSYRSQKGQRDVEKVTLYGLNKYNDIWEWYPDKSKRQHIRTPIVFTPDGNKIVFAVSQYQPSSLPSDWETLSTIVVIDASTGNVIKTIEKVHTDGPKTLAISKDGRYIATASMTGIIESETNLQTHITHFLENRDPIRVWDLESGKLLAELPINHYPWSLAFSPDGQYLVSGDSIKDRMAFTVWEWRDSHAIQTLEISKYGDAPFSMAFGPDGKSLASANGHHFILFDFKN
jgi:WD40 repeat protein